MTKKKEKVLFHTRNKHGIRMARCCMSCAYKEETELKTRRVCALDKVVHHLCHMCHDWEMSRSMQGAGTSGGKIKRREYLMFALEIRYEEQLAEEKGEALEPKSIEAIRAEFESKYGSVYWDF